MFFNLTLMLFLFFMMTGIAFSVSSNNWMMVWVGLEISLMSFIPLIDNSMVGSESSMKYFIIQGVSSSILMLSLMMMILEILNFEFILIFSLMLKMGVAPLHVWVLSIIEGLSYELMLILFTFIKIPSIMLISYLNYNLNMYILMTLIIGSLFGLNQNSFRKLLAYSSIFNMGFILSSLEFNSVWFLYLMIYLITLFILVKMINLMKINYLNQLMINSFNIKLKISLWISLLSMGGMPPMLGFVSKLMLIEFVMMKLNLIVLLTMIMTSLLVMFYYIRTIYTSFLINSLILKWNLYNSNNLSFWMMILNLFLFPTLIFVKPIF
uniref:NADH-ubiquinone oxidoreductase chain 2 n=1 Tax=Mileewa sharpa TaxID=2984023 RepID=A0A977XUM4_9HEMI|nr:NADH dehydrogenase subunit 2 [Mileewa sharpa]UXX17553.1 NADH dehydrogenase subunit 2 [Mileewa sharpa]